MLLLLLVFFSGKFRIVKLVSVSEGFVSAIALLGEEDEPSVVVKETLERLVASLYEVKLEIDVNEARYKLFTKETTSTSVSPTIKERAINASCGKKALDYHPNFPSPIEHGWTDID